MQQARLHGRSFIALVIKAVKGFNAHDMSTYAAALAFHILLALFPFIIFLIALFSFFELSDFFDWLRQQAKAFLPPPAMEQVDNVIDEMQLPQKGLLSFGAVTALWLASRGMRAIMTALNVAYRVAERRPVWKLYPLSLVYTLLLAIMLLGASGLLIIGPQAMQWLARFIGLEQLVVTLWTWLRWPAALFLISLAIAVVYFAAPNIRHPFHLISAGSVIAVLVWLIASIGFGYYVQNFGNYSVTYGSVGAVIVLLLYLYISSAALLFGAEVNAAAEGRAWPRPDNR